jgi:hypothetical protein
MHTVPRYVIYTAGRTGSQIISRNLSDYYNCEQYIPSNIESDWGVVHCHNCFWTPPGPGWTGIASTRQNDLEAMFSNYIARSTREFIEYSNSPVDQIQIEFEDFEMYYLHRKFFYCAIDRTACENFVEISYEDLVSDRYVLFDQLGLHRETDFLVLQKSPYNYKTIVKNWQQVSEWYGELDANFTFDSDKFKIWKTNNLKHV